MRYYDRITKRSKYDRPPGIFLAFHPHITAIAAETRLEGQLAPRRALFTMGNAYPVEFVESQKIDVTAKIHVVCFVYE